MSTGVSAQMSTRRTLRNAGRRRLLAGPRDGQVEAPGHHLRACHVTVRSVVLSSSTRSARVEAMTPQRLIVWESKVARSGRRFAPEHETALEPAARRAIKNLPGADGGVVAVREVPGPFGVPDSFALIGGRDRLAQRQRLDVPERCDRSSGGCCGGGIRAPTSPISRLGSAAAQSSSSKSSSWPGTSSAAEA